MNWLVKSVVFQALSRLPGGQPLYHAAQRRLTGSTRPTDSRLLGKIEQTVLYWSWLADQVPSEQLAAAVHLELGTGWLPSVPVTFYALGINHQHLVDIAPHLQPDAVVDTVEIFRDAAPRAGVKFARLPAVPARGRTLAATLEPLGMTYTAPYDDLAQELGGQVDFITATHMLLHLDRGSLLGLFRSVHALLKPGGFFFAQQHLRQLFDGLDSKTSPFYSLRYSDWLWENIINSPMMSYNRLRPPDYRELLGEAGFEIAHFNVKPGTKEELAMLDRARIHPSFSQYSREELAASWLFFVARKRPSSAKS
jgi:SAM-dependent methyltransferase